MQELKFRNIFSTLFVLIVATVLCIGVSYIKILAFAVPVPLLVIGLFAGFIILSFIFYPKASTIQTIQLTAVGILVNVVMLTGAVFGINYLKLASVSLNSELILLINPLIVALSFLSSFIILISMIKFEDKTVVNTPIEREEPETGIEDTESETIPFELKELSKKEEKQEEPPKSLYEELYPQAKPQAVKVEEENVLDEPECFMEMEDLPSFSLEEEVQEEPPSENTPVDTVSAEHDEEYFDYIPTDVRLVEAPVSKDSESKGKIASIGKLLVNNRDIEEIIESGEISAEQGLKGKTNIVSSDSGEHTEKKFSRIKQEFSYIKEIALIDKGGFILASNMQDKMKINIIGALAAGVYHTLQNYLAQISFSLPEKLFFETENVNCFIARISDDQMLFSTGEKECNPVEFGELKAFLTEEITEADFTPLVELGQIKNFAIANGAGQIIESDVNNEQSQKQGIISSALFENIKVFLMNIQLVKLSRITIFNADEIIIIQKSGENIASFRLPKEGLIKLSDDFVKIEEIYLH